MKIAIWHNLPSGGGKRALYDHVRGLLSKGHFVEAWCPQTADTSYLPMGELIHEHVVPLKLDNSRRSRWGTMASVRVMRSRLQAMDDHCAGCAQEINAGSFDVLFANTCSSFASSPIARHVSAASLLYLQEPYRALYEAMPASSPWAALPRAKSRSIKQLRLFLGDLFRMQSARIQVRDEITNAASFDIIAVNSKFSRESVLRAYGLNSIVCYLGVDLQRFYPTSESKENFVIGLGALYPHKGPDRAIEAVGALPVSRRPTLVWVGNSAENRAYEAELRSLARARGVKFELKVRITDEELRSLLSRAALLLYTSRMEPFGFAPLEANACGTLAVALAEGGVRETIQDGVNGLLVDDDNPQELARAMARVLDDPSLVLKLAQQSVDHVRSKWSLEAATDRLEAILMSLASPTYSRSGGA